MDIRPDFIIQQEVLKEYAWNIFSNLLKYLNENNISISNKRDPLVAFYWFLAEYQENIVRVENNEQTRLDEINGFLNNINDFLCGYMKGN